MSLDTGKYYKKALKKAIRELENRGLTEGWAEDASRALMDGEAYVQAAGIYLCQQAGDDRRGTAAQRQASAEQALDMIRAGHRNLSILGAQLDVLDIPGEGGR